VLQLAGGRSLVLRWYQGTPIGFVKIGGARREYLSEVRILFHIEISRRSFLVINLGMKTCVGGI
jgi:hypothetical protein